jgi:hypothetical protein
MVADKAQLVAGMLTLKYIIVIPAFLIVAFIGLVAYKRKNKTVETLNTVEA